MDVIEVVHKEVAMTQVAMRDPPLCLEPGYANEEGHARGMAAPEYGWFEVVNKTKQGGEIIAVLVAANAAELAIKGHDITGQVAMCLRDGCMRQQTVMCAKFGDDVESLQIALFYGAKYKAIDKVAAGNVKDNFEFVKCFQVQCYRKNVLLKFRDGALELQKGEGSLSERLTGGRRSVGGGILMKTNVTELQELGGDFDTTRR